MIQTRSEPCWYLAEPSGAEYDTGTNTPHFDTAADAGDYARETLGRENLTPHRFARPCVTVVCATHGTALTGDVWGDVHFDDPTEARDWLDDPDYVKRCPVGPHDICPTAA
jgi:hypothetical protein